MRNPLSDTIVNIKPSGIRKFFDIVSEMNDPEVILTLPGISGTRAFILWSVAGPFIRQIPG